MRPEASVEESSVAFLAGFCQPLIGIIFLFFGSQSDCGLLDIVYGPECLWVIGLLGSHSFWVYFR